MQPGVLVVVPASSASMGVEVAGSASTLLEVKEKRVAKKSIDWFESRMCSVVWYGSMRCAERRHDFHRVVSKLRRVCILNFEF